MMDNIKYYDKGSEMAVLGSMLICATALSKGLEKLKIEHFYSTNHKIIFKALTSFKDKKVDFVILTDFLREKKLLNKIGGDIYISELINKVSSTAHTEHYCNIVLKNYFLREQDKCYQMLLQGNLSEEEEQEARNKINDMAVSVNILKNKSDRLLGIKEVALSFLDDYQNKKNENVKLGFYVWDDNLDLKLGEMLVIGGRPEACKSLLAMNLFNKFLKDGLKTIYFPTEMKSIRSFARLLSINAETSNLLIRKKVLGKDLKKNIEKTKELSKKNGFFFDKANPSIEEIKSVIGLEKPKVIIIDQLTDIKLKKAENKAYAIGDFIRELHSVCMENNVLCICIAHINRQGDLTNQANKKQIRPNVSQLKYSGDIEQTAEKIILIWKEEGVENIISTTIGKNRDGGKKDMEIRLNTNTLVMQESYFEEII